MRALAHRTADGHTVRNSMGAKEISSPLAARRSESCINRRYRRSRRLCVEPTWAVPQWARKKSELFADSLRRGMNVLDWEGCVFVAQQVTASHATSRYDVPAREGAEINDLTSAYSLFRKKWHRLGEVLARGHNYFLVRTQVGGATLSNGNYSTRAGDVRVCPA